jgi:hypothetical protein
MMHHLGGVVDEVDGRDFADFGVGLHGDDALAAANIASKSTRNTSSLKSRPYRRSETSPGAQRAVTIRTRPARPKFSAVPFFTPTQAFPRQYRDYI